MLVTFKIKETIAQMIERTKNETKIKTPQGYTINNWDFIENENGFTLSDNSGISAWATAKYEGKKLVLVTSWSSYTYTFAPCKGGTLVTYDGAFMGFLAQNLLPVMTPILTGKDPVTATDFQGTLSEYCAIKLAQATTIQVMKCRHGEDYKYLETAKDLLNMSNAKLANGWVTMPRCLKPHLKTWAKPEKVWSVELGTFTNKRGDIFTNQVALVNGRKVGDYWGEFYPEYERTDFFALKPSPKSATTRTGMTYPVRTV